MATSSAESSIITGQAKLRTARVRHCACWPVFLTLFARTHLPTQDPHLAEECCEPESPPQQSSLPMQRTARLQVEVYNNIFIAGRINKKEYEECVAAVDQRAVRQLTAEARLQLQ